MIDIRRKSVLCREVWFDEPWSAEGADLVMFYHWSRPENPDYVRDVHSLELDLTIDDSELLKGFTASTRNQINRARREAVQFYAWVDPDEQVLNRFVQFLVEFATERGLGEGVPLWMRDYAAQGALLLTNAAGADGNALVWHSYYRGGDWVRQLHSVSRFAGEADKEARNAIGRANRFLHWADMIECRRIGVRKFDFGGWYSGDSDQKLLRVNAFKEEFGGRQTLRYHSMLPVSLKGKLFLKGREYLRGDSGLLHVV